MKHDSLCLVIFLESNNILTVFIGIYLQPYDKVSLSEKGYYIKLNLVNNNNNNNTNNNRKTNTKY